jgi:DNA polymerase-3 subunit beta
MKFVIQREAFVALIGKIQGVVPTKPIIPILSNVLIQAEGRNIVISATDLTVSVRAFAEGNVISEGSVALPARRLFQLTRELTAPEITIETDRSGVALISAGSSHFRMNGLDEAEFPTFPDLKDGKIIDFQSQHLSDMFANTAFAAARDDSRQVLNGVYLEIKDGTATLVGTDGKRLAKLQSKIDDLDGEKRGSIIPLKAVEEMIRVLGTDEKATLTIMPEKIALECGDICLISKLLSGQFPDFERVIPNEAGMKRVSLHREELLTLLKQVSLFTSDMNHSVKLTFDKGDLRLQATNSDIGEGKVNMPVDYHEEKLEIAFNPQYFIDILRHCKDETVDFGVTDSYNPGSVKDSSEAHYVLMPMRLS